LSEKLTGKTTGNITKLMR